MTETSESGPEVPDLWWSPKLGVLQREPGCDGFRAFGSTGSLWGWCIPEQWPADAIQLAARPEAPRG